VEALKALVRTVPDFPKPGILFYDITTLLKDKTGFAKLNRRAGGALYRAQGRPGSGHRGAGVHLRAGAGLPAQCRLCAGAQATQVACPGSEGDL